MCKYNKDKPIWESCFYINSLDSDIPVCKFGLTVNGYCFIQTLFYNHLSSYVHILINAHLFAYYMLGKERHMSIFLRCFMHVFMSCRWQHRLCLLGLLHRNTSVRRTVIAHTSMSRQSHSYLFGCSGCTDTAAVPYLIAMWDCGCMAPNAHCLLSRPCIHTCLDFKLRALAVSVQLLHPN